jgi:hypothetical protein
MVFTHLGSGAATPTRLWPQDQPEHRSIDRLRSYGNKAPLLSDGDLVEIAGSCRAGKGAAVAANEHQAFGHSFDERANGPEPHQPGAAHG